MSRSRPENLVKVYEGMIVPGQPLSLPLYSNQGELLAQKGKVLDERQAVVILRFGDIYTERSHLLDALKHGFNRLSVSGDSISYRFPRVFNRLEEIANQLPKLYTDSSIPFTERLQSLLRKLITIVEAFPEASLASVVLNQNKDLWHHAVNCAIVSHAIIKRLEWKSSEVHALVSAALTMDCSLILEDEEGLKPQDKTYYQHQSTSRAILEGLGVSDERWLDYVAHHHGGNEDNARAPNWGEGILSMADTFCSRLTGIYGGEISLPHEVLGVLQGRSNSAMERLSFDALVSAVGVYPLGSIVLLQSGEVAIVTELTNHLEKPIVRAIYDKDGSRWQTPILRKTDVSTYGIKEVLPGRHFIDIIDLHQFWQ